MKTKKIPTRQCMGCNIRAAKSELLRVVRSPEGVVSLDFTGRKPGRGAYICRSVKCLRAAKKSRRLGRILECEIPDEIYSVMEIELEKESGLPDVN